MRIADRERQRIIELALDEPTLSPRELSVRFIDTKGYSVSEASVYRLLKAAELIASPAFIVIKAAEAFKNKTTAPNQLWQPVRPINSDDGHIEPRKAFRLQKRVRPL